MTLYIQINIRTKVGQNYKAPREREDGLTFSNGEYACDPNEWNGRNANL